MNRWTLSIHEAGHAVVAFALTGTRMLTTLHQNGGGAAWALEELSPTDHAIMAAAGPLSEHLANRYAAPEPSPPVASDMPPPALPTLETVATVETAADLHKAIARAVPDHITIARWCIAGVEKKPERWAQRHAWVHTLARRIISDHEKHIVEVARVLYLRGVVSVPLLERNAS